VGISMEDEAGDLRPLSRRILVVAVASVVLIMNPLPGVIATTTDS
jgi:hypothetical protein